MSIWGKQRTKTDTHATQEADGYEMVEVSVTFLPTGMEYIVTNVTTPPEKISDMINGQEMEPFLCLECEHQDKATYFGPEVLLQSRIVIQRKFISFL
jgi:hypothetical protein